MKNTFERDIVNALNSWYLAEGLNAIAYKRYAPPRHDQEFDVISDSYDEALYLAFECKSVKFEKDGTFYWRKYLSTANDYNQIERETKWLDLTGRTGFFLVEFRFGPGKVKEAFIVPWRKIKKWKRELSIGVSFETIMKEKCIPREGKQYMFDGEVLPID